MKIKITNRLYWFGLNGLTFLSFLFFGPFIFFWGTLGNLYVVFFVTDGSVRLMWPNEWNWKVGPGQDL